MAILNDASTVVDEALEAAVLTNPHLRLLKHERVLYRADYALCRGRVALVSGGGAGHEPSHAGWVGRGMLTAAVSGQVFASPSPQQVLAAIKLVAEYAASVLLIVKNYTGDRLSFGLAMQRARALGIAVEMVVIGDDCALPRRPSVAPLSPSCTDEEYEAHSVACMRRGLAGTILVHKIAGSFAEDGMPLEAVAAAARAAARAVGTASVAFTACSLPGRPPSFTLAADEMEMGLGIHGEQGHERVKRTLSAEIAAALLDLILSPTDTARDYLQLGAVDAVAPRRVALLVNGLGATTALELGVLAADAHRALAQRGFQVPLTLVGSFMTSLNMAGASLSVMLLNDERIRALTSACSTSAWPSTFGVVTDDATRTHVATFPQARAAEPPRISQGKQLERAVRAAAEALIEGEMRLNELDAAAGDGDCGTTMAQGARAVLSGLSSIPFDSPSAALAAIGDLAQASMGGSSGVLYGILLQTAAAELACGSSWAAAFRAAIQALQRFGGALPGDRTMLDALGPAHQAMAAGGDVAAAAEQGARATAHMKAGAGRSAYIAEERLVGITDPGAEAASVWIRAVASYLTASP